MVRSTGSAEIVELVNQGGGRAVGLTGSDGAMLRVRKRLPGGKDIGRINRAVVHKNECHALKTAVVFVVMTDRLIFQQPAPNAVECRV